MLGRIAARTGLVIGLVGMSVVGLVWTSGPAQANTTWLPEERQFVTMIAQEGKVAGARGIAPNAARAAKTSLRFCKGGPVACGVISAGSAILMIGIPATAQWWVPWIEEKMNEANSNPGGGTVTNPCSVVTWAGTPPAAGETYLSYEGINSTSFKGMQATGGSASQCNTQYTMVTTWNTGATGTCSQLRNAPHPATFLEKPSFSCMANGSSPTPQNTTPITSIAITFYQANAVWPGIGWGPNIKWEITAGVNTANMEVNCIRPDGTEYSVVRPASQVSQGYVAAPQCDPGDIMTRVNGEAVGKPGTGFDIDLKPRPEDLSEFPRCDSETCLYRVFIDADPCQLGMGICWDWTRLAQTAPNRVECYYGPYKVLTTDCDFLERAYETTKTGNGNKTTTDPNTDGNPDTHDSPAPDPAPPVPSPSPSVTSIPSPTATVQPAPPGYCSSPYNLGAVMPQTAALVNDLGPRFNIQTVGGYRENDAYPDHPSGLAADFMTYTATAKGENLALYATTNAAALGIDYVMWDRKIWSQSRQQEGWRPVADRGSVTANHEDHVHITMLPVSGSVPCTAAGDPINPDSAECFPGGFGAMNPVNWVLMPLKCAFIPRRDVTARVPELRDALADSGPVPVITGVGDLLTDFGQASGCAGPTIPFSITVNGQSVDKTIQPLNACAEPMKTVAGYSYALSYVTICIFGGLGIARAVAAGFGFSFSMGNNKGGGVST